MKFRFATDDFVKMGGTALVSIIATYLLTSSSTTVVSPVLEFALPNPVSQRISLHEAHDSAAAYRSDPVHLQVAVPGSHIPQPLEALRFDARQLDTIINHNVWIKPGGTRDSVADEVVIYFSRSGVARTTAGPYLPSRLVPNIHLIAVGAKKIDINSTELMVDRNPARYDDKTASSIYDKTHPCPRTGCPVAGL